MNNTTYITFSKEEGRQCPNCGSYETKVNESKYSSVYEQFIRKRECKDCGTRWQTKEVVVAVDRKVKEHDKL